MSDFVLDSKWTWGGALLLGVGTLAAAGGIAVAVHYCMRSRRIVSEDSSAAKEEDSLDEREGDHESLNQSEPPFPGQLFPQSGFDETDFGDTTTYEDLYKDIQRSIQALIDNKDLYSGFIKYVLVSSRFVERLKALLEHLKQWESALQANQPVPKTASADISAVVGTLRTDHNDQLAEVQTLISLARALLEFPVHIVKNAKALTAAKRQTLVDLIRTTPAGVSKHVYISDKYKEPYEDPDLCPIMTRMGFSIPPYQTKLTYTARDGGEDKLHAGLYLLLGTSGPTE